MTQNSLILHLCNRTAWQAAQQQGEYRAASLDSEGFIHCSRPEQILKVANAYYPGAQNMVLLWIVPERLQPQLRWETSDQDTFPHLYGPLNLDAVTAVTDYPPDPDGTFRTPPQIA